METFPVSAPPEELDELQEIAMQFQELSLQQQLGMQQQPSMQQRIQQQQQFIQPQWGLQEMSSSASVDSTVQTGLAGPSDWQEEVYQLVKRLKDLYFAELCDLHNKISLKLHHVDILVVPLKSSDMYEKMKNFKIMLERALQFLLINKSNIQPDLRAKLPKYERQFINILNSQRRRTVQTQVQQQFQPSQFVQAQGNLQDVSSITSMDSTTQTGHAGTGDWQEEIYQMVKRLKDLYFAEICDLHNKISLKLQHVDSLVSLNPSALYENMKNFKTILDQTLQFLQINKSNIQPALRDKIPAYERQIINIINSQRRKDTHVTTVPAICRANS